MQHRRRDVGIEGRDLAVALGSILGAHTHDADIGRVDEGLYRANFHVVSVLYMRPTDGEGMSTDGNASDQPDRLFARSRARIRRDLLATGT